MEHLPPLESLALFKKVVEAGSFAKVVQTERIPKASLSRKISQLEEHYGAQLLVRTTRNLKLTEIGQEIYARSQQILSIIYEAQDVITKTKTKPQGLLRISAGVEYGLSVLSPLVSKYSRLYPEVNIELDLTGRRVDLVYEGFDLGVRIGPLEDSTLSARRIGSFQYGLYVSPKLKKVLKLKDIQSITELPTLAFSRVGKANSWRLVNKLQDKTIPITPRLISNNYWVLMDAAIQGLGVVFMPHFLAEKAVKDKKLEAILPEWSSVEIPVHLIYPSQRYLNSKVRSFIDFCIKEMN